MESCLRGSQEISAHPGGQVDSKGHWQAWRLNSRGLWSRGAFGLILRAAGCGIGRGLRASFCPQDCSRTWGQTDPASGGIRTFCGRNRRQQLQRQQASADQPDRRTEEPHETSVPRSRTHQHTLPKVLRTRGRYLGQKDRETGNRS